MLLAFLAACSGSDSGTTPQLRGLAPNCDLNRDFVAVGAARDAIPSLTNPEMATPGDPYGLEYLAPDDRVIAFEVRGRAYAVPHNILWHHEIVNLDVGGRKLAVTYCPLTGSSLVFDRGAAGGAELGVSGLLYKSNLVMFERRGGENLWPQMLGERRCTTQNDGGGSSAHPELTRWPSGEMTWAAWSERHPEGLAVTWNTGFERFYRASGYPYGSYEEPNAEFRFPMPPIDSRRPPKERIVGAPSVRGQPGIAFPFGRLFEMPGDRAVVEFTYAGEAAVLLWSDAAEGGRIFRPKTRSGNEVTLEVGERGIVDVETGSRWWIEGRAIDGPRQGQRLVPVEGAYVAFWGAWAAFFPETRLWQGG